MKNLLIITILFCLFGCAAKEKSNVEISSKDSQDIVKKYDDTIRVLRQKIEELEKASNKKVEEKKIDEQQNVQLSEGPPDEQVKQHLKDLYSVGKIYLSNIKIVGKNIKDDVCTIQLTAVGVQGFGSKERGTLEEEVRYKKFGNGWKFVAGNRLSGDPTFW